MDFTKKTPIKILSFILAAFLLFESPMQTYAEQSQATAVTTESEATDMIAIAESDEAVAAEAPGANGGTAAEGTESDNETIAGEQPSGGAVTQNETDLEQAFPEKIVSDENQKENAQTTKEKESFELSAPALSIEQQTPESILLRWNPVENAQEYSIYRDEVLLCSLQALEGQELSFEDTEIAAGEEHTYKVIASANMEEQVYTSEAAVALIWDMNLQIPSISVFSETKGELTLNWEKAEGADGYLLYRMEDDGNYLEKDTTESSYTFTGLEPGKVYRYAVWPYSISEAQGRIFGLGSASVLLPTKLEKVTLKAEPVNYKLIKLTWDRCEGSTGYRIYRKNKDGEFGLLKIITSGDILEYKDTGLLFDHTYEYMIQPVLQAGGAVYEGEESEPVSARTVLGIPGTGTVTCTDYETLEVTWKTVPGAVGYEVYRAEASDGEYRLAGRAVASASAYVRDKGVMLEKTYYYKVRAYRMSNGKKIYGEFSEAVSGATYLAQVTGLKVAAVNYSTMKLTWDKVGAQKYQIYYSTEEDSGYRYLTSVAGNSYQFDNVICGQVYYFKVRASCAAGGKVAHGDYSSVVSQKTTIKTPSARISQRKYNRITVQWGAVAGAQQYELYWSDKKDGDYEKICTVSGTSYTHTGLELNKTYYYKVCAIRQKCVTDFSGVVSGKTILGTLAGLTVSRSGNYNKLTWSMVEGVTRYQISRATSQYGEYIPLGTVSGNSYTDTSASKYRTYYYKVYGTLNGVNTNTAGPVRIDGLSRQFYGIDVSAYQGNIDWKKVAGDGIDFAMIRIITGNHSTSTTKDTKFEANYSGARSRGIKVGVYRYSYATSRTKARNEAKAVIAALDGRPLDYPIVMDVEDSSILNGTGSNAYRSEIILAFKEEVEKAGYKFAVYANLNWLNNYLDMNMLSDVDIWIARWRSPDKGHGYNGKGKVTMWQYTDSGRVNGISGNVDRDISYKDY